MKSITTDPSAINSIAEALNICGAFLIFIPFKTQLFGWLSGIALAVCILGSVVCFIIKKPQSMGLFITFMVLLGFKIIAMLVGTDHEFQ